MGTAADYDDAVFVVVVGLGLLRPGLTSDRVPYARMIRVADAWVPLLIMLLLGLALRDFGCFG